MLVLDSVRILLFPPVFLLVGSVHASPSVQTNCNESRPVICPKYGTCCSGVQFCAEELGTCEECFPLDITTTEDRLKLCSEMAKSTNTVSMRHYSCSTACYHLFSHGEISNYTEQAPAKTTKELIDGLIAEYKSSRHKQLRKIRMDIKKKTERLRSLEDQLKNLKINDEKQHDMMVTLLIIGTTSLVLATTTAIVCIIMTLLWWLKQRKRKNKCKKIEPDFEESKQLFQKKNVLEKESLQRLLSDPDTIKFIQEHIDKSFVTVQDLPLHLNALKDNMYQPNNNKSGCNTEEEQVVFRGNRERKKMKKLKSRKNRKNLKKAEDEDEFNQMKEPSFNESVTGNDRSGEEISEGEIIAPFVK